MDAKEFENDVFDFIMDRYQKEMEWIDFDVFNTLAILSLENIVKELKDIQQRDESIGEQDES